MEHKEHLNYHVVFPTHLLEKMPPKQAILCGLIIGLSKMRGYAYASNDYLSQVLNSSRSTIKRMLSNLESEKYIIREVIRDNSGAVVERRIQITSKLLSPDILDEPSRLIDEPRVVSKVSQGLVHKQTKGGVKSEPSITKSNNILYDIDESSSVDLNFEHVWGLYHRKGNKKRAAAAWNRLTISKKRMAAAHIKSYIENHRENNKIDFLPHFSTYLNNAVWEDQLPYGNKPKTDWG